MTTTLVRPENWVNKFEIDLKGNQDPTAKDDVTQFAPLSQGLQTVTPSSQETVDTQSFWNDKGGSETDITGKHARFAMTLQRVVGDPAQDYVVSRFLAMGDNLRTLMRWTDQGGNVITSNVTLTAIVPFGGNANARQTVSFTIEFNGQPVLTTGGTSNDDGDGVNGVISGGSTSIGDSTTPTAPTTSTPTPAK